MEIDKETIGLFDHHTVYTKSQNFAFRKKLIESFFNIASWKKTINKEQVAQHLSAITSGCTS